MFGARHGHVYYTIFANTHFVHITSYTCSSQLRHEYNNYLSDTNTDKNDNDDDVIVTTDKQACYSPLTDLPGGL